MNWSIPDVLRINDFSIEVKLTVQHFFDQEKNRLWWWDKHDLPLKTLKHKPIILTKNDTQRPDSQI